MLSVSGRGVHGEAELRSGCTAALYVSGVLQWPSIQHPNPLHANDSAVRSGKREERRGGTAVLVLTVSLWPFVHDKMEFVGINECFAQCALSIYEMSLSGQTC